MTKQFIPFMAHSELTNEIYVYYTPTKKERVTDQVIEAMRQTGRLPGKGKWINHLNDDGHHIADCSECGHAIQWFDDEDEPRFCCMCGAKMEEIENGK